MQLTKFGHACVVLEHSGQKLVIDPGEYTQLPEDLAGIIAVVVTHNHPDHTDPSNLAKIVSRNPNISIYALSEILEEIDAPIEKIAISGDHDIEVGNFNLQIKEIDHAVVYGSSPCRNLTVRVNDYFYHPGDSYEPVTTSTEVVGVPMSGPWSKTAEAIDYALKCNSKIFIPIHNGHLNKIGHHSYNNWLNQKLTENSKVWQVLEDGQNTE